MPEALLYELFEYLVEKIKNDNNYMMMMIITATQGNKENGK